MLAQAAHSGLIAFVTENDEISTVTGFLFK